jgi:hypothetical protein
MRALLARNGIGALRLASAKGEIFAGSSAKLDHQIVRRYAAVATTPLLTSFSYLFGELWKFTCSGADGGVRF